MITINQGETVLTHFKAVRRRQGIDRYVCMFVVCYRGFARRLNCSILKFKLHRLKLDTFVAWSPYENRISFQPM